MGIMDPRELLSIGQFAGLTHLSVKALGTMTTRD